MALPLKERVKFVEVGEYSASDHDKIRYLNKHYDYRFGIGEDELGVWKPDTEATIEAKPKSDFVRALLESKQQYSLSYAASEWGLQHLVILLAEMHRLNPKRVPKPIYLVAVRYQCESAREFIDDQTHERLMPRAMEEGFPTGSKPKVLYWEADPGQEVWRWDGEKQKCTYEKVREDGLDVAAFKALLGMKENSAE